MTYSAVAAVAGIVLVLAKRFPAGFAILAAQAGVVQPGDADSIAFVEFGDAGTEGCDNSGRLVPGDERRRRLDRPVALCGMQIGMAYAAGDDLHQYLAWAWPGTATHSIASGLPNSRTTAAFIILPGMILIPFP